MTKSCYYEILGVDKNATDEELKTLYYGKEKSCLKQ
jgi:DnaJ-class molecular chaperone